MAINPKGRIHLNESTRDTTIKDTFFSPIKNRAKKLYIKPFDEIKSKAELVKIKSEVKRLYKRTNKTKGAIITLMIDKLGFTKTEALDIFRSVINGKLL